MKKSEKFGLSYVALVLIPLIWLSSRSFFSAKGHGPSYLISTMQAAEGGNVYAKFMAGISRGGTEEDRTKWLREAAEQGHLKAQATLARNCEQLKDYEQAALWYRKAAEQGDASSQCILAELLDPTRSGGQDKKAEEAMFWYRKAADQGSENALEALGAIYSRLSQRHQEMRAAVGIPEPHSTSPGAENYITAYAFFSLSAYCDGNPPSSGASLRNKLVQKMSIGQLRGAHQLKGAQSVYAEMLKEFKGRQEEALLEEKEFRAAEEKALVEGAEGGEAKAQLALGWKIFSLWRVQESGFSFLDVGVVPVGTHWDVEEAFEWWRKAAEQGDAEAQYILGVVESGSRDDSLEVIEAPPEAFETDREH